jgi:hypothetical protein
MPSATAGILTPSGPATNRKNSTSATVIAHNKPIAMRTPLRRRVATILGRASIAVLVPLMVSPLCWRHSPAPERGQL